MGTFLKVKTKLALDKDLHKMLVRGGRHEILLDLEGDGQADVGLIDKNTDGDIDTIVVDLTGAADLRQQLLQRPVPGYLRWRIHPDGGQHA